jgi:hypothetical protein
LRAPVKLSFFLSPVKLAEAGVSGRGPCLRAPVKLSFFLSPVKLAEAGVSGSGCGGGIAVVAVA